VNVATRQVTQLLDCFRSPFGLAWLEDGVSAWVTHLHVHDRLTRVSRVDLSSPTARVTTQERTDGAGPQDSAALTDPISAHNIAEGGYLTLRGHLAQKPGGARVWVPTQYGNRNQTLVNPDSIIQATIREIDLTTRRIPNTINDKIILTAKQVHDPQTSAWLGPGWDSPVAGPVDISFSSDGSLVYLVFELSENVLVMPTSTPPTKPGAASPLPVVTVGHRPSGIAVSPVAIGGLQKAYVANLLSRTVSVLDVTAPASPVELHQIAVTPSTPEPLSFAFLNGERLFHSSNDPRISANRKVACGSCHLYGEQDGRAWDLQHLPGSHGPRQTQSLLGLGASYGPVDPLTGLGQLHRSGDRDEVQDFDHTFSGPQMGGTGFIPVGQLHADLGAPNAGLDPDLDDVEIYLEELPPLAHSPYRSPDGSLSEAARRGATFFLGPGAGIADGKCASCHVPETGWVDFTFHDVGQRHDPGENELNTRPPLWGVNTASLVGIWDSPPYIGASSPKDPETLLEEVIDLRNPGRTKPHGTTAGLRGHQLQDLAEFLGSIDGTLSAAEVRATADTTPPRVVRVEPASLTRVNVWFSESVAGNAADPAAWRLSAIGGSDVPITGAVLDAQNADRVTLTVNALHHDCGPVTYQLVPMGPIDDLADSASGGTANLLDVADPQNTQTFVVGDTLTVTFGASGYESFTVPVHDGGTIYSLVNGANESVWLRSVNNGAWRNTDFVRFEWEAALAAVAGVITSSDILDASLSLDPYWGDSQTVEARRVLQHWWDPGGSDQILNPPVNPTNGHRGPTYRDSEFSVRAWNLPNAEARAAGVNGAAPGDYFGLRDTAFDPDAVVSMGSIHQRLVLGGPGVASAFRFWYANPTLDWGYALNLAAGGVQESRFHATEEELRQRGPVLTVTYRLPPTSSPQPPEVSGPVSGTPLLVSPLAGGNLRLSFQDLAGAVGGYNIYDGTIGSWYSHAPAQCGASTSPISARRELDLTPAGGNTYYLVTAFDVCVEGTAGSNSAGTPLPAANLTCGP
jgi:hypothetical protein